MTKKTLTEHLTTYYGGKKLSPASIDRFCALLGEPVENPVDGQTTAFVGYRGWRRPLGELFCAYRLPAVAIAVSVLIVFGYVVFGIFSGFGDHGILADAVAREIAMNHNKNLDIEFPAKDFTDLRKKMTKLDFSPVRPDSPEIAHLNVLGGRYCSIQGHLAAQIKLTDASGNIYTLYQTLLVESFSELRNEEIHLAGLTITIRQQQGLLMGLAERN